MNNLEKFLAHKAYELRVLSLKSTTAAGSGHPTSCLSAADIVATLFFHTMRYDPKNPKNPNNDRFVLSKGHAAPVLYAAWEQAGAISEAELMTLRKFDSVIEGHPTPRFKYIDVATGSLGQGLSNGIGMALDARLDTLSFRTYVLMGDSEISEGSIWEAALIASYYKLNNLIGIVDVNRLGQTGQTVEGYDLENYAEKFKAFGWQTYIINGHDMSEILQALNKAHASKDKPTVIIAKTIKGYGLHEVANKNGFHGKAFSKEELPALLKELERQFKDVAHEDFGTWKPQLPEAKALPATSSKPMMQPTYKKGELVPTRVAYGHALAALGTSNPDVVSLDAEVKNSTYAEVFEQAHPERFFQCFIAEQNMVGMATGFASRGKIPYASTFASFMSRAYDQIRMAAISRAHVCLVGSHAGVSIGQDGPSQMGLEDIAMLRAIPDSVVLYPSDAVSTWKLVEQMAQHKSVNYLRTTRGATPVIYDAAESFPIGGCKVLHQTPTGDDVCIITAGITLVDALKAHEFLTLEKIKVAVIDLYCIKPLPLETLISMAHKSGKRVITVEDHYLQGGLGEAVTYALRNQDITIECLAVTKLPRSGTSAELFAYEDLDMAAMVQAVKEILRDTEKIIYT